MCINKDLLIYSNIVFFILVFLLIKKKYNNINAVLILGIISLCYHITEHDMLYACDILIGCISMFYILNKCNKKINYWIILLILVFYFISFIIYYYDKILHAYLHSIWHTVICMYILYMCI